ncbi:MAG: HAD family hydrolase [Nanoarchaeota archaeon]|nr:HAD family hydrolase [Nanoarchaeota archaeon]
MIISFDMDGTIFDTNFDDVLWFEEIPRLYAEENKISFEKAKEACMKEYSRVGDEDLRWYDVKYWLEHFGLKKEFRHMMNDLKHRVKLYPEAKEVIKELSKEYKLIVISNAMREFTDIKMEVESVKDYFDRVFSVTTDFGIVKKEESVYREICKILKVKPQELVHIGDHYKFDYEIPRKAGIKAYYLDRKGEKEGENIVKDLKEFKEKISQEPS